MSEAAKIARALGGVRAAHGYLCRCPLPSHGRGKGDRRPSLSVADGDRALLVHCHAGCDTRDVLDELRRRGLLGEKATGFAPARAPIVAEEFVEPKVEALALWRGGEPIGETSIARRYLLSRSIMIEPPPSLRFCASYEHIAGRIYLPAIVAALQSSDRRIIAVQVTLIDPRGDRKAQVRFPRKTFGRMGDGAVRLGPAGERLGLAEGVETGLSAMQLFGLPVWCSLGAGRMHNVAIPDSVRELHIFSDNDAAGRAAAEKTADAHRHRRVVVHYPTPPAIDFNDTLVSTSHSEVAA